MIVRTLPLPVLCLHTPLECGLVLPGQWVLLEEVCQHLWKEGQGVTGPSVGCMLLDGGQDLTTPAPRHCLRACRTRTKGYLHYNSMQVKGQ